MRAERAERADRFYHGGDLLGHHRQRSDQVCARNSQLQRHEVHRDLTIRHRPHGHSKYIYDTYGIVADSLDSACALVQRAIALKLEPRESSYRG